MLEKVEAMDQRDKAEMVPPFIFFFLLWEEKRNGEMGKRSPMMKATEKKGIGWRREMGDGRWVYLILFLYKLEWGNGCVCIYLSRSLSLSPFICFIKRNNVVCLTVALNSAPGTGLGPWIPIATCQLPISASTISHFLLHLSPCFLGTYF